MTTMPNMPPSNPPTPDEIGRIVELIRDGSATPENLSEQHRLRIADLIGSMAVRISDLESELDEAKEDLYKDSKTELLNARGFEVKFADWLRETDGDEARRVGFIFVDMDSLKRLNDEYSHEIGDIAIKRIANALKRVIRKDDIAARLNGAGDEFVLALPEARAESIDGVINYEPTKLDIAEYMKALPARITAELEIESLIATADNNVNLDQHLIEQLSKITFSYGGEVFDDDDLKRPLSDLLNVVDKKMYEQKAAKRSAKQKEVDSAEYDI